MVFFINVALYDRGISVNYQLYICCFICQHVYDRGVNVYMCSTYGAVYVNLCIMKDV